MKRIEYNGQVLDTKHFVDIDNNEFLKLKQEYYEKPSFEKVKKPEQVLKLFVRFALAKAVITYGLELMLAIFKIIQGIMQTIMHTAGFGDVATTTLPQEMIDTIESCGFFESIPLWAVTLIRWTFNYNIIIHYDFNHIWKIF